jgi:hypothetical protein
MTAIIAGTVLAAPVAHAATITVINNCNQTIWPGIYIQNYATSLPYNGGWSMAPNAQVSFSVPNNSTAARLWARKNCNTGTSPYQCATGSCGGSGAQCQGTTGVQGTSLFEFTLVPGGQDTWDVSYVDGYDFPIGVTWNGNSSACTGPTNLSPNPTCNADVLSSCPSTFQVTSNGSLVQCDSPCTSTQNTQYCCSAYPYNQGPAQCAESSWPSVDQSYVNLVHQDCPGSYGYAYDDLSSTWNCPNGSNYVVTFCPNGIQPGGGSSTGGTTGGGSITPGIHTLTPQNATGSRLDDNGAGTTNGTKIQIWTANGTAAQQWNFNSSGVSPAGDWNVAVNLGPYCLDAGSGADGTPTQLWACDGSSAQSWNAAQNSNGTYTFTSAISGLCLDVAGAGTADGTVVQSAHCYAGDSAQQWAIN